MTAERWCTWAKCESCINKRIVVSLAIPAVGKRFKKEMVHLAMPEKRDEINMCMCWNVTDGHDVCGYLNSKRVVPEQLTDNSRRRKACWIRLLPSLSPRVVSQPSVPHTASLALSHSLPCAHSNPSHEPLVCLVRTHVVATRCCWHRCS